MAKAMKQFTIKLLKNPVEQKLENDIKWICSSLGFMSSRDQDDTSFKILRALMKSAKKGKGMTSEELTDFVQPTQGAVIYHLKKLQKAGLVVKLDSEYSLKMNSILSTIEEIEKDIHLVLGNIKAIANDVDDKIGLEHRPLEELKTLVG
ncbi:winged helix-turn-helix transcriptional regulator [Candidatus Woesearchaeota archaeon]|nr:winged helix-turn-helix transcriptional regulator [Candidatus Woesearchaeota archaeon]